MKNILILMTFLLITLNGCMSHNHIVGKGPKDNYEFKKNRQFYGFLVYPLNNVDVQEMVQGATDYSISTRMDALDLLITNGTAGIISSRTVVMKK